MRILGINSPDMRRLGELQIRPTTVLFNDLELIVKQI